LDEAHWRRKSLVVIGVPSSQTASSEMVYSTVNGSSLVTS